MFNKFISRLSNWISLQSLQTKTALKFLKPGWQMITTNLKIFKLTKRAINAQLCDQTGFLLN